MVETLAGDKLADVALAVVGRRYELVPKRPGILRVRDVADPDNVAYVIVPAHPYVAITDDEGTVRLASLPAGRYRVEAWQRPLTVKQPPRRVMASIDVVVGGERKLELSLAP